MITKCSGVSADFSGIVPGEAVWLPGHIGVYIGGGKVIECSPAFKNCVQVTACLNIGAISGMNGRKWTKHGKLPYITYDTAGGAQDGAGSTTKPSGTTTTPATLAFAVGDVVRFTGNTHYTNAAAASGAACKPGTAKVTALAKGRKAPLPPYQTARRRFYRLRLGQCGGRAGRRERYDRAENARRCKGEVFRPAVP